MKWVKLLLPLSILIMSCVNTPVGVTPSPADSPVADFITIWEDFEVHYPEFPLKSINWELMYGKYLPLAEEAATDEELMMEVVLPMLAELEDAHLWLINPEDVVIRTFFPDYFRNYNMGQLYEHYLNEAGFTGYFTGVGYCIPESLPYLSINSWKFGLNISIIDEFVSLCQDQPGIIIDVRMNGGGSDAKLEAVVGRFTLEDCRGWMIRTRSGPDYDQCSYETLWNTPLGVMQYPGKIYLLIGENCASSNEEFILCMDRLPNVTLVGDTTLGALVCPEWRELSSG